MKVSTTFALSMLASLLFCAPPLAFAPAGGDVPKLEWAPPRDIGTSFPSLTGRWNVNDLATAIFEGEGFPSGKGRLGHFQWTGDINGDGLNDIALSAPGAVGANGAAGDGKIYIYFGNGSSPSGRIDMGTVPPDILMIGRSALYSKPPPAEPYKVYSDLGNELEAGDYNGDGYRDLVVPVPISDAFTFTMIFWGRENGLPSRMEVEAGYQNPVTNISVIPISNETREVVRDMGLHPREDSVQTPNYMMTADIDRDGKDELISGGAQEDGWYDRGLVMVRWGDTGSITRIGDGLITSKFGRSLDIGDIDGDGELDLLVGAPSEYDPVTGFDKGGMAAVVYNLSMLKGNASLDIRTIARPIIWGSREGDSLGKNVALEDIDGDGRDDIIVAAPNAPSIQEDTFDSGRIYMWKGGDLETFPSEMDADSSAQTILIGSQGKKAGDSQSKGDCLGQVMDFGDLNGDGSLEMVLGIYNKKVGAGTSALRDSAGAVLVYGAGELFAPPGGNIFLKYPSGDLCLEGDQENDLLGWHLFIGDANNDGAEDLMIGAPGEDGYDDLKPQAGATYLLYGSRITIGGLTLSGTGAEGKMALAGGYPLELKASFESTGYDLPSLSGHMILDQGGSRSDILIDQEGAEVLDGPVKGLTVIPSGSGMAREKDGFSLRTTVSLHWDFGIEGKVDVAVAIDCPGNITIRRDFPSFMELLKDVELSGRTRLEVEDERMAATGCWVRPQDVVSFGGLDIVYSKAPKRRAPFGSLNIGLYRGALLLETTGYEDGWILEAVMPQGERDDLRIAIQYPEGGHKLPSDMQLFKDVPISLNIDALAPMAPDDLIALSSSTGGAGYDKDGDFLLSWSGGIGRGFDHDASGVKEYRVTAGGRSFRPEIQGGLFGTYYGDTEMDQVGFERVDQDIEFTRSDWGFWGPDPLMLPVRDFSARWHGSFIPSFTGEQRLTVQGSGLAMVVLNDRLLLDLTDVRYGAELEGITMTAGSSAPIEIYFINLDEISFFSLKMKDGVGNILPVPSSQLSHPATSTTVHLGPEDDPEISVRAVDWTEHYSEPSLCPAFIDDSPPELVLYEGSGWTTLQTTKMKAMITDGASGSGVNLSSIAFRTVREVEGPGEWSTEIEVLETVAGPGGGPYACRVSASLELPDGWKGWAQFRASDLTGNTAASLHYALMVDRRPPTIDVILPANNTKVQGTRIEVRLSVMDLQGSGFDNDSLMARQRRPGGEWGDWNSVKAAVSGPLSFHVDLLPGPVEVQFMASDIAGNKALSEIRYLTVFTPPMDMPPVPMIKSPENNTVIYVDDLLLLDAQGTSDDGLGALPEPKLTWTSSIDGLLGTGNLVTVRLSKGVHRIRLYADDGAPGHNVSVSVTVEVRERAKDDDDDGGGQPEEEGRDWRSIALLLVLAAAVLTLGIAILLLLAYRKRSSGRQVRLDMRELSEDDRGPGPDEDEFG